MSRRPAFRPRLLTLEDRAVPAVILSDNLSNASGGTDNATGTRWLASSFSTDASAHSLTSVTLKLAQTSAGAAEVDIYTDASLQPTTQVAALTSPSTYATTLTDTTFTSSGVSLAASTVYWVVLKATSGAFDWSFTNDSSGTGAGPFQHTHGETDDGGATWFTGDLFPNQMRVTADETTAAAGALAFSAATYTVAESGGTLAVTVTRTGGSSGAVSVPVTVSGGTATSGTDYTGLPATASFADGATTATVTITIVNDTLVEGDETISLALGTPTGGATLGTQTTSLVTITDDDTAISFSSATYSVNESAGTLDITLTRAGVLTASQSVTVGVTGGTATQGTDYTGPATTATFAAGASTTTVSIAIVNDTLVEGNETILLAITSPTGGATVVSPSSATVTIVDDDTAVAFSAATYSVGEAAGTATVTLTRSGVLTASSTVQVTATGGTATSGSDYSGLPVTVTFAAGAATASAVVTVVNDTTVEGNETVLLGLANPSGSTTVGSPSAATLTIVDDDTSYALSAATYTVSEGGGAATVTVTRTGVTTAAGSVVLSATGGTATSGSDYTGLPVTVSFAAGQTTTNVSIPIIDDSLAEGDETVLLALGSPSGGATVGSPDSATLTITDNDTSVQFDAASTSQSVSESVGTVTFALTRTGDLSQAVSVNVAAAGGSASTADYSGLPTTVNFAAGQATATFAVTIVNDTLVEGTETLDLALSGAAVGTPATATLTITDDDTAFAFGSNAAAVSEGAGSLGLTVVRTGDVSQAGSVDLVVTGGTASTADYSGLPTTVTFAAGQTSATVTLTIVDDTLVEGDETLILGLANPSGTATIGSPASDTLTIVDNDTPASPGVISVADVTLTAAENGGAVQVRLARTGGTSGAVSVTVSATGGTATNGTDYTFAPTTVTFADGQAAASFTVTPVNDVLVEGDETAVFAIAGPTGGATLGGQTQSTLTITDDDVAGLVQFSATDYTVSESAGTVTITVTRTGSTASPGTVDYATAAGTAGASDFTPTSGTLSFAAGQASATFTVAITQDALGEGDEQFTLALSNPTGGAALGSPTSAAVTIQDDAAAVALSAAGYAVSEAGGSVTVTVTRSGSATAAGTVAYATSDGTAVAGTHYTATSGTLTFAAGQATATFSVPILDNSTYGGDRTFTVTLSTPAGELTLGGPATATVTILDNEVAQPGALAFSAATYAANEGDGTLTLTLTRTGGSDGAVTVLVSATGGTATSGSDYSGLPATATFADGQTTATVTLSLVDDTLVEGAETIALGLSAPTGGATLGGQATATVTIADNDTVAGAVAFSAATYSVGEGGGTLAVTLTRTGGSAGAVSVVVSVTGGTATSGSDYSGLPATATFADGQTTASVVLAIIDDALVEGAETVQLALGSPTGGATVGAQGTATVTIADNDTAAAGTVRFDRTSYSTTEDAKTVTFNLVRNNGTSGPLTVTLSATGGTATAGSDYTGLPTTVTFADGQTTATVSLTLRDDNLLEGPETVELGLTGGSAATLTIADREQLLAVAAGSGAPTVNLYTAGGTLLRTVTAYAASVTGGVRVATADLTGDGIDDLIVGNGPGSSSLVKVFDGRTGAELASFSVFEASFTGGVYVAAGDMDGDGRAEVVVTPDEGGGPVVAVYGGASVAGGTPQQIVRFYGIDDPAFRGGARPAVGDVNGDGRADLLVAAGFQGGPRLALYNGTSVAAAAPVKLVSDFFAFESTLRNGTFVALGDVDGDGKADVFVGGGPGGGPRVRVFSGAALIAAGSFANLDDLPASSQYANVFAGDASLRGGVRVAAADYDGDGVTDLITASGEGEQSAVRVYKGATVKSGAAAADVTFDPFGAVFTGGVFVG